MIVTVRSGSCNEKVAAGSSHSADPNRGYPASRVPDPGLEPPFATRRGLC